ncbi:MAG: sigma-70 family RNA polymerase sigma factor [Ignavibacteria bacterium]|nr:sigma-70 family RNA polymerase sigma factor [Ignavibacteria bacterium]
MKKDISNGNPDKENYIYDDQDEVYLDSEESGDNTLESLTPSELAKRKADFEAEAIPHMKLLYNYALRMTNNQLEADDLLQDTYLRAFRFFHKFEKGTNCKAWLFRIMKNCFINKYRKNRKEPSKVDYEDVQNFYDSIRDDVTDPNDLEYKVFSNLLDDDVINALNSLPDDYKTVVILCDLEGLSYEEIAEFLNVPIGTVRSRLHRGRKILQRKLQDYAKSRGYVVESL